MNIPLIPQDKANHVIYGALLGRVAEFATVALGHPEWARLAPVVTAAVAGAIKEAVDQYLNRKAARAGLAARHGVEWADFGCTVLGGVLVTARP